VAIIKLIMMSTKKMFMVKLVGFIGLMLMTSVLSAQNVYGKWDAKSASKWVKQNEWRKGLTLQLHPSTDKIAFATQFHKNEKAWDEAFKFLRRPDLDTLSPGKYPIDGDMVYATISVGPNKEFDKTRFESHRKYIDLQYVIKGKEKIGVAQVSKAMVTVPYSEPNDIAHYTAEGKYYIATPGTFFLFFPVNAHRPGIKVDGYDTVKKLVIKIEVAE
jgi:YhcH/YjgK/YiaL family protein